MVTVIKNKVDAARNALISIEARHLYIVAFAGLYAIYLAMQYADLFFESQFLHIPFLKELVHGNLTFKGFFTVFGEHLFPGYNIVLAANYYLFGIWGGFDSVIHFICLVIVAVIFSNVIRAITSLTVFEYRLAVLFSLLTLISTTNNPQWGMALAAAIGVSVAIYCFYKLSVFLHSKNEITGIKIYFCIPFVIVFFLGGYSVGFIAGIFFPILVSVFHDKRNFFRSKFIVLVVLVSVLAYAAIVMHYSSLMVNRPTGASFDVLSAGKFFTLMVGSSLLGRATFEFSQSFVLYYICGLLMLYWAFFAVWYQLKRPSVSAYFFLAVLAYSLTTILVVSLFRYKNGIDGGMGQWYNVHTHFIAPVILVYLLLSLKQSKNFVFRSAKIISIVFLVGAALLGYAIDFKKAYNVPEWKQQFIDQAITILISPEKIQDKEDTFNSMLWPYRETKAGIDFLYQHSLWHFKQKKILVEGVSEDKWVVADKEAQILCPGGSRYVSFDAWRPEDWVKSSVQLSVLNDSYPLEINNKNVTVELGENVSFLKINANDKSFPITSIGDPRKLIFIINNIKCYVGQGPQQ